MLVGKELRYQQLKLINTLEVGQKVIVENKKANIESIYEITDQTFLNILRGKLKREVLIYKNHIRLFVEKEDYNLDTRIKTVRLKVNQII